MLDSNDEYDEQTEEFLSSSQDLISLMERKGLDLSQPRLVTHLFFGEQANIRRASGFFQSQSYEVLEVDNERLLVGERAVVSKGWVEKAIPSICQAAGEFELNYDGWDVDASGVETKE